MFTYFVEFDIKQNRVFITTINATGQTVVNLAAQFENATVKENAINERVYIINSEDEQSEYLSLPIASVVIKTVY